jgi:hypothetical protein
MHLMLFNYCILDIIDMDMDTCNNGVAVAMVVVITKQKSQPNRMLIVRLWLIFLPPSEIFW